MYIPHSLSRQGSVFTERPAYLSPPSLSPFPSLPFFPSLPPPWRRNGRHGGLYRRGRSKLTAHILNHNEEAEKGNLMWLTSSLKSPSPHLMTYFKVTSPRSPQTVPLTGDWVFKHTSLCPTISLRSLRFLFSFLGLKPFRNNLHFLIFTKMVIRIAESLGLFWWSLGVDVFA